MRPGAAADTISALKADSVTYRVVEGWEQLPRGYVHRDVAAVGVDKKGQVYLFCRGEHPVMVYSREGRFLRSWGEGKYTMRTHGLTIGPDDSIWLTDDADHTVRKCTLDGEVLLTLGASGTPSDSGYDGSNLATITHRGAPFNRPTNVAIAANGDVYVSDGYGNCGVHRFTAKGELIQSWGEPGTGPGQFMLVHSVAIHPEDGRVFVCDREGERIQIFTPDGKFLDQWTDVQRPTHLMFDGRGHAIVSELMWRAGMTSYRRGTIERHHGSRISILDAATGRLLSRLGDRPPVDETWGSGDPHLPGNFCAPHGMALDANGDLYVAEVTWQIGVRANLVRPDCHTFQKFELVR